MKKQKAMIIGSFIAIITGTILACRATSKLDELDDDTGPIGKAKAYLPSIVLIGGAFAVILRADALSEAEITSLSAGYAFSRYLNSKWEEESKKILGSKEQELKERVYGSEVEEMAFDDATLHTEYGSNKFYDPLSRRRFECSIDRVRRVENLLKEKSQNGLIPIEVNAMYRYLGLPEDKDLEGLVLDEPPVFGYATFTTKDGEPCTVLIYKVSPKWWVQNRRNDGTYNGDQNGKEVNK